MADSETEPPFGHRHPAAVAIGGSGAEAAVLPGRGRRRAGPTVQHGREVFRRAPFFPEFQFAGPAVGQLGDNPIGENGRRGWVPVLFGPAADQFG